MYVCMLRLYVNYSVVDGVGEAINELITSDLDEVKKGKKINLDILTYILTYTSNISFICIHMYIHSYTHAQI